MACAFKCVWMTNLADPDQPRICAHCGRDEPPAKVYRDQLAAQAERIWLLEKYRDDAQVFANEKHASIMRWKFMAHMAYETADRVQRLLEYTMDAVFKEIR